MVPVWHQTIAPAMSRAGTASDYYRGLQFSHGLGAYCWTTDGRRYIDLVCGQGPVVLGHAHPGVRDAVIRQLGLGTMLPGPGPEWARLKGKLLRLFPHYEDVLPFKTGSEAVSAAIRLCRAFTQRNVILRVGFHGWHDPLVSPYVRCHSYDERTYETSWPVGVPHDSYLSTTRVWHGDDPAALVNQVVSVGEKLAAVLIDPVQLRSPAVETVRRLWEITRQLGVLLIFDESKTGLRVHLRGAQHLLGVDPDLTILSKALANGLPLAVVLGKTDILHLAHAARIKGTFNFEMLAISAAVATVETLEAEDGPKTLNRLGGELLDGLSEAIRATGWEDTISAIPYQWPCLPYIRFLGEALALKEEFFLGLRDRGVLMLRDHMSYVSLALTTEDISTVAAAAADVLRDLASARHRPSESD